MAKNKLAKPTEPLEIKQTNFSGTTDSNGNIYNNSLNTTDHVVLSAYATDDHSVTFMLNGQGSGWNYHISSYTEWNVTGTVVTVFVNYIDK